MTPEVLAPAGAPECLPAAVAGGADAVYLGLRHFNARGRAENFRKADLPRHVAYLHRHGLKCYVVLNTLVHDDEHAKAIDLAWHAHVAGVDAAIIQDLGLWRLLRRTVPGLPLHASTQMTVHDPSQVAVLAGLGAERVILARELSLPEIRACAEEAARHRIEIEHFVHGALCYAFSGQCLMSNFAGCRSANRGTCAQNCRFVYHDDHGASDTVISLKDLALIGRVADLARIGVASLKIEGRLKGPDYVYATARAYRAAADAAARGERIDAAALLEDLRAVFARPFTAGPLDADNAGAMRMRLAGDDGRRVDAHLERLDRRAGTALLRAARAPAPGTGFAFSTDGFNGGFQVIGVRSAGAERWEVRIRIAERGPQVPAGTPLTKNSDPVSAQTIAAALAAAGASDASMPLRLSARGSAGAPLAVTAVAADGRRSDATSDVALAPATGAPLTAASLAASLGACGGSGFRCVGIDAQLDGPLFLPAAELKRVRRVAIERLAAATVPAAPRHEPPPARAPRRRVTALWAVVGSLAAARACRAAGAAACWLDDARLDLWAAAAPDLARDEHLWLRHPAVSAPSPHLAALGLPVVAGHLGVLAAARAAGLPVIADVALNVFNLETLALLATRGAQAAVISLELSGREIARLAARAAHASDLPQLAIIAHGRVPAMLTRQRHALAPGERRRIVARAVEGGLPYELEGRTGDWTAVWEARRLCCPERVKPTAGLVDAWVLELADLAPEAAAAVVAAYARLREGGAPDAVLAVAARAAPDGLFPGHLRRGSRELDEIAGALTDSGGLVRP